MQLPCSAQQQAVLGQAHEAMPAQDTVHEVTQQAGQEHVEDDGVQQGQVGDAGRVCLCGFGGKSRIETGMNGRGALLVTKTEQSSRKAAGVIRYGIVCSNTLAVFMDWQCD